MDRQHGARFYPEGNQRDGRKEWSGHVKKQTALLKAARRNEIMAWCATCPMTTEANRGVLRLDCDYGEGAEEVTLPA
jgi:hypothetical protein